jgi:DNA-binding CsgD family transcriptional regulator
VKVRPGQSSTLDTQFGPRAASVTEFASAVESGSSLSRTQLDRLFRAAGGRSRIADSLLTARAEAGIPIADADPDRTVAMLAPELTPTVSGASREAGALYLLALFAWTPQITSTMVDLVHAAFSAGQVRTAATPEELTSLLTSQRLLTVAAGTEEVFTVPSLIRVLMRRITEVGADCAAKNPREALGAAITDALAQPRSADESGFSEAIGLAVETSNWKVLERVWARRSVNVFVDVPTAIEAYLGVPEDVLADSPVLTLARSAARRIDSTRRRLRSDDTVELVAATDFDSIVVPGLHGLLSTETASTAETALTADEVTVLTTLEARTHRMNLDTQAALDTIETGRERLRSLDEGEPEPTLMLQAELNLEHGRNLVVAGRFPEAMRLLQLVVQFAEIYTPNSPHPLLTGLVEAALASMGHGQGSDMDRSLERARESARGFGMAELPNERTALCIEAMRRLDRLDTDAADRILAEVDEARPGQYLGPIPDIAHSLCSVYQGRASIAAKMLTESSSVRFIQMAGVPSSRQSGIINIAGFVLVAAGETKTLQDLGDQMSPQCPGHSMIKARQALTFGQHDRLWTATAQTLSGDHGPRVKSCAAALRVELLHHEGRTAEALEAFVHVLDYCAISSSVLGIAQLSKATRQALISASAEHDGWQALARSFGGGASSDASGVTAAELQRRLLDLPETLRVEPAFGAELTSAEQSLLFAIDSPKSIAQIAKEFGVVPGTLKNRLSALYRKLGVRSRTEAIAHAHRSR